MSKPEEKKEPVIKTLTEYRDANLDERFKRISEGCNWRPGDNNLPPKF